MSWFSGITLWASCLFPFYYLLQDLTLPYPFICHLLLTSTIATILFLIIIYMFRVDSPMVYTQFHSYPHECIIPFLSKAKSYHPTPWLFNRYLETYIPGFIQVPLPFKTTQEVINVKSPNDTHYDGECSITWTPFLDEYSQNPEMSPILLIIPGLTGDINAKYCRRMMIASVQSGWQSCIFNPRYYSCFCI